ncbi:MAG: RNA polymerase sigma-70 factor [Bacteroidales bacterium]|nr:RNA polymerase sigma-70 factor [Bacteroidales bacterium]
MSDKTLIRRIKNGNKACFRKLFDLYYQRLLCYANSYLDDPDAAEDIVQDMFIHLWEKRKDLVIFSTISSYLFRAIHNRCIQYLRHQKVTLRYRELQKFRIREAEILYNNGNDFSFSNQQMDEIQGIYTKTCDLLPDKTREIFHLSREESKSNREIAGILGIEIKTVEYHMTKALKTMRLALKEYFMIL